MQTVFLRFFLVFAIFVCAKGFAGEPVRISNTHMELAFDEKNGALRELKDLKNKHPFLEASDSALWKLDFARDENKSLAPANAGNFKWEKLSEAQPAVKLIWDKFEVSQARDLRVEVIVRLDAGGAMSRWKITVENLGKLHLQEVHFPRVSGIAPLSNEYLAVPNWMGQLAANPRTLLRDKKHLEWDYPGHTSMQCFALYQNNGPGLYFSCDDTNSFRKSFLFAGDGQNLSYEMVHLPENQSSPRKNYSPEYQAILGTFEGDWVTAAEIYRKWAKEQYWARESRLQRHAAPDWVLKNGFWVWNRGRSENVLQPATLLQKELQLPVSVFWHWWHGCAYDTGFPEYLPPREGADAFTTALAQAQKNNIHAIVYMNQRLWGMTTKSWKDEGAETFAVKGPDGQVRPEVYNTFTKQPCASMCMGTPFWRNKYAGLAEQAIKSLGVNGIYMDQACSSLACYDSSHGHPIGGGTYWMSGFRMLSTDIRHRASSQSGIALAGEGVGEAWLPYLDLMLSLQVSRERYSAPDGWEPIPFFHAVYHPYAIFYGNYSSLAMPPYDELWPKESAPEDAFRLLDQKFSRQFYMEQARAFVWGQQPTIANFTQLQRRERGMEIMYAMRLARVRNQAIKYLLYGTYARTPTLKINVPDATIDMSRLSIYAGQQGGLTTFQKTFPQALAGAWRAADGQIGVALANISDNPVTVSWSSDLTTYGLPKQGALYRIDEWGRKSIGQYWSENFTMTVKLGAREACMIEFGTK